MRPENPMMMCGITMLCGGKNSPVRKNTKLMATIQHSIFGEIDSSVLTAQGMNYKGPGSKVG